MTRNTLVFLAAGGSFALLAGAFLFQSLGYAPCEMCLWQRWPHAAAIVLGGLALTFGNRIFVGLGGLAALTTCVLGFYHSGVEQHWWAGPSSCTGGGPITGDLLAPEGPRLIMCDQISWAFAGLSMPTWNGILSLGLVILWIAAYRAKR